MAMDFISGPTSAATATVTTRSPDSDTDTPPHPPPAKRAHHLSYNNRDNINSEGQHVSYKECLKNHAATIGGHALDGCCEFMPGPTANPLDPTSLTCAACGCHRNFHRRDPDDPTPLHHLIPPTAARRPHSPPSASQLLLSLSGHTHSPSGPSDHEMVHNSTASAAAGGNSGGVVMGYYTNNGGGSGGQNGNFQSKKRFRTKFSQDQKDKMYDFSEKIGWRLKKGEERLVQEFCKEVGVDRSVFKVWMHNNKHSGSASAPASAPTPTPTPASASTPASALALPSASASASPQRREKSGIINADTTTLTSSSNNNGNHGHGNANNNNNNISNNNNNNVGLNCGGVLGSALEFNFANCGGQEAKAQ